MYLKKNIFIIANMFYTEIMTKINIKKSKFNLITKEDKIKLHQFKLG